MPSTPPGQSLRGRRSECEALDRLVAGAKAGRSQVLLLRGETGVGKTALLEFLVGRAAGCRIARAAGVEAEMELPFAGLHQLCLPFIDRLDRLPGPQADALGTAFGVRTGSPPARFLVGLGVLSLLAEVSEERPLVCIVDDLQWLDRASAQVLAFVARRLVAESIGFVLALRDPADPQDLAGLADLVIHGLGDDEARALLDSVLSAPLDERVCERIVAETRGNPLALLELPRGFTPEELAGGFGLPATMPMAGRIEEGFIRQLQPLSLDARRLLLTAAAEPTGDATLLWRAATRLGISADAAVAAEASGLVALGASVRFRHPLLRSAVCRVADPADLLEAHRALAEATDAAVDPDRRAWHRAQATVEPNEEVAGELERSAGRAQGRGGVAAAAAFLARATELTPDPARRGMRALAAAQAKHDAGAPDSAFELLSHAETCPLDVLQQALSARLRASLTFAHERPGDTPSLLDVARRLVPLDAALARETYLEALGSGIYQGRLSGGHHVDEVARAARHAGPAPDPPRTLDLLLEGLTSRTLDGYAAAVPPLRKALQTFAGGQGLRAEDMRWMWLAWPVAYELWDDDACYELTIAAVTFARDAGALTLLPLALVYRAGAHVLAGEFTEAAVMIEEAGSLRQATGNRPLMFQSMVLTALEGHEARASEMITASMAVATAIGEETLTSLAEYTSAVLGNGVGRYDDAVAAAGRACEHEDVGWFGWALAELVEAGARSGNLGVTTAALSRLEERTSASGTDWALGIEACCRALLSDSETAGGLFAEAIERLGRTRVRVALARTHLLHGEWLRREGRRVDARDQLRTAHGMLTEIGMDGFAERARRELLATGEKLRRRSVDAAIQLTPQEAQIAGLARDGHTNPEIGAALFLSPRTVEWHLRNVFTKLGITSRRELRGRLPRILATT